jgi:hypothetical protein
MPTTWHGDRQDGIELRYDEDGDLDEVVLHVDGRCVLHVERMDNNYFWMGLYAAGHTAHANIGAKRADVAFRSAEGWRENNLSCAVED